MRDILLVSCFNELTNKIYDMLIPNNKIQLCQADADMLHRTIDISKPELIIVLLNEVNETGDELFVNLSTEYNHIPVLCCGTESEQNLFKHYFSSDQYHVISTPDNYEPLYAAIDSIFSESASENDFSNESDFSSEPEADIDDSEIPLSPHILPVQEANPDDKKAILLVDDDPLLLRTVRSLLHNKYKILMATSGAEALVVLGRQSPDLIILDYNMPVCDGRQTLKMIRELESAKDIPVVFLTSIGDKPHIEMALKLNPAGYLLKPVKEDMLFEIIDQIL